ncbi:MAG: deoxyribose-phosphate aldolase [Candidatus Methanomethylicaceae archaeon]
MLNSKKIAKMIDHSLLRPELTIDDVIKGCELAKKYNVASVCVKPCDIPIAKEVLKDSDVMISTVVGFPHGSQSTKIKLLETEDVIREGAVEVDIVINIGRLLSKDFSYVEREIREIINLCHQSKVLVKVILENCYLNNELKIFACKICENAGADFVKTSTGFGTGGATIEDVKLMRNSCSPKVKIKAAGGIRSLDTLIAMYEAGAERFGATATEKIIQEAIEKFG